jgi:LacI family transcriptional regulator, galactose operon repressor
LQFFFDFLQYFTYLVYRKLTNNHQSEMAAVRRKINILFAPGLYSPKLHHGVARFAGQHDWHLNVEMTYSGRLPANWKGDGILTLLDRRDDLVDFITSARVPVVGLAVIREDIKIPRVTGDNLLIGRLGAEHLLERAFRHLAWFSTSDDPVSSLRMRGFCEFAARAGFTCRRWNFQPPSEACSDAWTAERDFLVPRLLAIPKPAAVFAFSDTDAVKVLDACDEVGLLVPNEVAILGVDNDELVCESSRVPLSSVNQDLEGIGYGGAMLLHRLMHGKRAPKLPILIPPKGVIVRRSTDTLAVNHGLTRLALQFLRENYRRRIGVAETAAACGASRRQLECSFRKHLGMTISEHLAALRLIQAKQLLRQTDLPIADVAAQTGFNTPQYFNNFFRKTSGITPRNFRLQHRINGIGTTGVN